MQRAAEVRRIIAKRLVMSASLLMVAAVAVGAQDQPVRRIRISGNVQEAKLLKQVHPVYPAEALQAKISGTVVLYLVVNEDGSVKEASALSGPPELVDSAIEAVKQWQYQPTLLQGQPIGVISNVTVVYRLKKSGEGTVLDGGGQQSQEMPQEPGGGRPVTSARIIKRVQPKYPKAARRAGITGTVVLHLVIGKDGSTKDIKYVSGPQEL